jgi:hypothetical protein
MRLSKILSVGLLALVCATSACAQPAQQVAQVVTVVVTAPPAPSPTSPPQATQTLATSPTSPSPAAETSVPSPTATALPALAQATGTLAPSPTSTIKPAQANTPTRTPAPQLPAVSNLPAQGPKDGTIDFELVLSREYLLRIKTRKHGSANDGDGIDHVRFIMMGEGHVTLYANTEKTAKYCIFQGGEPDCNPWPKTNGHYVWGNGGPEIKSGEYQVTIRIALKSDPTNESEWNFFLTIKLP